MEVILTVDFGSSSVRVHAVNVESGEIIAGHQEKYPFLSSGEGFAEHDPEEEWKQSVICFGSVIGGLPPETKVRAITFSHIGSSLVPMDEFFCPTYPCILGMDSRASEEGEILRKKLGRDLDTLHTSFTCSEISTMAKTLYIKRKLPEVAAKTKYYVSIQQYILKKLGLPLVWDATEAGSHCCFDNVRREWSQPVLEAVGISKETLGRVVNSHEIVGEISRYGDVELGRKIPVVIGGHDAVMGTIGLGVGDENGDAVAEVTGTVDVFCFLMNRIFSFSSEDLESVQRGEVLMYEPGPLEKTTAGMAGFKTAGAVIEWFMREFYKGASAAAYSELWNTVCFDGLGKVFINPDFTGGRGLIEGIDITTTKYDIYKACIEALTFESRRLLEICRKLKKGECRRVRVGGGHANSDTWIQLRADMTGMTYERMANNEVSALGAAILAAYGTGAYKTLPEAISHMAVVKDRFLPRREITERYDSLFENYVIKRGVQ